ncbi:MAG: NAD(+)/NADH kinase [Roseburia sp.]|nr:NAD(+)/NADH kinase [Roseburia sp.]
MKHFLMITNIYKDAELRLTEGIKAYIEQKGGTCVCMTGTGEETGDTPSMAERAPRDIECVLVLGGDGTLIRAAAALVGRNLPLIGVNLGTLGYLCELEEGSVFAAIDQLMEDRYIVEERMMLTGHGCNESECNALECNAPRGMTKNIALNDIVIHRTGALSVISLIVYVNGEYLNTFRADGIIISTPTGSTGYNMSAGGPIVDPKAEMILITPINAHNLNSRSIVIGAEDEIVVEIGKRRSQRDETAEVSFDGDSAVKLGVGDRFFVGRAKDTALICKISRKSFLEILSKKMQTYT